MSCDHVPLGGCMYIHAEDLEMVAESGRLIECEMCDMIYVADGGWIEPEELES